MTTVIDQPPTDLEPPAGGPRESYLDHEGRPDVSVLQDRMPESFRLTRGAALLTLVHGILFTLLSFGTIWHTDVWGHLSYGRWIVAHNTLPATEPLLPLCEGVPFINPAWLSQVLGALLMDRFGISVLLLLYAASITLSLALVAGTIRRRTGSAWGALAASTLFYFVDYQQLLIFRPQLAGLVLFSALLCIVTSPTWRSWYYVAILLMFAAWANLHGSFVVGLLLLGTMTVGRWGDMLWRTGTWNSLLHDRLSRRLLMLTELAALATLVNPYGLGLLAEVFAISRSPNFADLIEWEPLTLRMSQGQAFFAVAVLLAVLYRFTPRRVRLGEVLLLIGLGILSLWTSRMIVWWAPVAAYYAALHGVAVARRFMNHVPAPAARSGMWTIVCVGLSWIFFAYTPFGTKLLHGKPDTPEEIARQFDRSVSSRTPVEAAKYLVEHPPVGQVFNTYEWGDYLHWAGPADIKLFVNSHAHLVPAEVWQDYMQIAYAGEGWEGKLDRYGVNAVIVDRAAQSSLVKQLEESPEWTKRRQDGISVIFSRNRPL